MNHHKNKFKKKTNKQVIISRLYVTVQSSDEHSDIPQVSESFPKTFPYLKKKGVLTVETSSRLKLKHYSFKGTLISLS